MPPADQLATALRFMAGLDEQVAGERVALSFGVGVFDLARPLVWDTNYVRVERAGDFDAAGLAEAVEPLFAERKLAHRQIVVSSAEGRVALQSGFEALGWRAAHELVMVLGRRPELPPHPVDEISSAELRDPIREVELMEPPGGAGPAVVHDLIEQLASRDALVAAASAERRFAVRADRGPVAWCRLYGGEGIGQVEQVTTHPAHRNRGYGRAVVSAAATASLDRGDQLTFLVALADGGPQRLYSRLGFEVAGVLTRFRRLPGETDGA